MKLIRRVKSKGYESFTFLGMRLYRRVETREMKRISVLGIPVYSKKTKDYRTVRRVLLWKTRRYDKQRQLVDMLEAGARERAALKRELAASRVENKAVEARLKAFEVQTVALGEKLEACGRQLAALRGDSEKRQDQLQVLQYAGMYGTDAPLISIILPVFNSVRYLRETLGAILAQTFHQFELICVDDGSTDGSGALLDEWALKDERISVIHQENQGAGPARNRGLEMARGRYVLFCDVGSICAPDMLSSMFLRAENCRADVVVCRSEPFEQSEERGAGMQGEFFAEVFSGKDASLDLFQIFTGWTWDKLFSRELLQRTGLRFPETGTSEDVFFVCLNLASAHRIAIVSDVLVKYGRYSENVDTQTRGNACEHIRVLERMADWLREQGMFDRFRRTLCAFSVRSCRDMFFSEAVSAEVFSLEKYIELKAFFEKYFAPAPLPRAFYESDDDFDFVHGMFAKKPCRLRYSVVMPCYNVEKYIDEALESLALQTVDFAENIECILVDDGSTDSTPEKIRQWAERFPNITCIHQENGGLSCARNAGLEAATCPWVTFIDPDDFLHPDYFHQIDQYLSEHEEDTAYVAGRLVIYWEQKQRFGAHPLDFKYTDAVRTLALEEIGDAIQCMVTHVFLRREVIEEKRLRFSSPCRPNFEDTHFLIRYLCFMRDRKAVYVKDARYLYRKREDGSSLMDATWQKKEQYSDLWEYGYADALEFCKEKLGYVPVFAQNIIMYNLYWYFRKLKNADGKLSFLSDEDIEKFWALFFRVVSYLEEENIVKGPSRWLTRAERIPLVEKILQGRYPDRAFYVLKYDSAKEMVLISHVESKGDSSIYIGGKLAEPLLAKRQKITFMRRDWAAISHSWYSVAGLDDAASITAVMDDGRDARIFISGQFKGKALPVEKLKSVFAQPQPASDSRFADAWLIMDRDESADDNGEHFYRWLMKHHPEQKAFFVLRREARDWARLEREGFALVDFGSRDYEELFKNCGKIISAHADPYIYRTFPEHRYRDFVFLQHGVAMNDISVWLNRVPASLFLTSAEREYESIAGDLTHYKYSRKEVALTGLPRHDALLASPVEKKRQILIMPTWRSYIVGRMGLGNARAKNPAFRETGYFKAWHSFLHSEYLRELAERYGFEIVFYPHQNSQPYLDEFACPSFIRTEIQGERSIQELFLTSSLMITDFSSVAMEMAYLGRPVLYYQFDEEEFFQGHWGKGYFDYRRDGFGPVVTEEADLLRELEALLARGGEMADEYRERLEGFFSFRDGRCCERTYEAILALDSPELS